MELLLFSMSAFVAIYSMSSFLSTNPGNPGIPQRKKLSCIIRTNPAHLVFSLGIWVITGNPSLGILTFSSTLLIEKYLVLKKTKKRTEELRKQMPFIALSISLLIESGSSVQYAIGKLVESFPESEGKRYLLHLRNIVQVGENIETLLNGLHETYPDETIKTITEILVNSSEIGVGPGVTLKELADKLLDLRLQKAEERALKAPVKLMLPLCGFIFPAIFLLIFTPIFFQIEGIFK